MTHPTLHIEFESLSGPYPASFEVHEDRPTNIGRAANCDVCLLHEGVSRKHGMIVCRGGEWFVVDLGSRAGTFLNGVKLGVQKPSALSPGDLLKVGPWTFRVRLAGSGQAVTGVASTLDDTKAASQRVERVASTNTKSDRRLRLLGECIVRLAGATDEETLAKSALQSALEGSGYARGAVLRRIGSGDEVQVVQSLRGSETDSGDFVFSRSLVRQATGGEVGVLTTDRAATPIHHSIAELRIHSAMCAPVFLGGSVEGFLYLDARGQEESVHAEAAGFCEAVARAYGLAMSSLKRIELQKRQQLIERDLEAAHEAQQMMLPSREARVGPIRYAMQMRPGLFVAGDLFDIVPLPGERVAVCVGDVAGHGVGSAMLMALAQSYLHAQLVATADAGAAVTALNRFVSARSTAGRFASLWAGVFSRSGAGWRVDFIDAGHGHWMVKPGDGGAARVIAAKGNIPVGIDPERHYVTEALTLEPRDRVILYSDGIIEQRNAAGAQFGREAAAAALAASGSPVDDVKAALDAIDLFAGGMGLDDDATVASIEMTAPGAAG